jgi:hypothetical protein
MLIILGEVYRDRAKCGRAEIRIVNRGQRDDDRERRRRRVGRDMKRKGKGGRDIWVKPDWRRCGAKVNPRRRDPFHPKLKPAWRLVLEAEPESKGRDRADLHLRLRIFQHDVELSFHDPTLNRPLYRQEPFPATSMADVKRARPCSRARSSSGKVRLIGRYYGERPRWSIVCGRQYVP